MPAEYGVDPTGIGAGLGLNKIGEAAAATSTNESSPAEAKIDVVDNHKTDEEKPDAVGQPLKPVDNSAVTLLPGKGAEIKANWGIT